MLYIFLQHAYFPFYFCLSDATLQADKISVFIRY